ncbi:hypothetical protein IWW51_001919, partial [Coemansia sp. RSA 2702]
MIARNLCQTVDTVLRDQLHMFVGLVKSSSLTDALSDEFEYILDEKDDPEPLSLASLRFRFATLYSVR